MPKVNHSRNFRDERDYSIDNAIRLAQKLGAMGYDFTKGKHGCAKNKRGKKKFVISRERFAQKNELYYTMRNYEKE